MTSKTKYNSLKDYIKLHLKLNETDKNNELEIRFGTNKSTRLSKMNVRTSSRFAINSSRL